MSLVSINLACLAPRIHAKGQMWQSLGVRWTVGPVDPNHGKAVVVASFESSEWLGQLTVWVTGEAELDADQLARDLFVSKHYNFAAEQDIDCTLDEFAVLIAEGLAPYGAVTFSASGFR